MKQDKYDLAEALYVIFKGDDDKSFKASKMNEVLEKTKLSFEEFQKLACQDQSIGQLKYRILGLMDRNKISSAHII